MKPAPRLHLLDHDAHVALSGAQVGGIVCAYERLSGLGVCFHDYTDYRGGSVFSVLGAARHCHDSSTFCSLVKRSGLRACKAGDIGMVGERLASSCAPFVKICHAGVGEILAPVLTNGLVAGVLFVGQFVVDGDIEELEEPLVQRPSRIRETRALREARGALPRINVGRVVDLARVGELLGLAVARAFPSVAPVHGDYRQRILAFLHTRTGGRVRLGDLAAHLYLSESRAGHVVREHFGKTFPALVAEYRMTQARKLLARSQLRMVDIARLVGIADVTYFHRLFRKLVGTTPQAYRMAHHDADGARWTGV